MFDSLIDNDPHLKPFQKEGVRFLSQKSPSRKILADGVGLGKSIQSIKAADIIYSRYKELSAEARYKVPRFQIWIVCPTFAVRSWEKEILKWSANKDRIQKVLTGKTLIDLTAHWVIMSYDIAKVKASDIEIGVPTILICDESHYLSHHTSQRCRLVLGRIGSACRQLWLLTGTLFPNKRIDGWTLFNACDPKKFGYWEFAHKFGYVKKFQIGGRPIQQPYGARNEAELIEWVKPFVLMRKSEDVLKDLPEFEDLEVLIKPKINSVQASPKLIELLKKALDRGESPIGIEELTTALRLLGESKIPSAIEYCANLLETGCGPLVIFTRHTSVIEGIKAGLDKHFKGEKRFEIFNGAVSGERRGELAEEYEAGKIDALCANIQAAGVNLTLVRGNFCVFIEEPWSPGELEQARGRIRRIGQNKFCVYSTLLVEGSLDQVVHDSLRSKRKGVCEFNAEYKRQTARL